MIVAYKSLHNMCKPTYPYSEVVDDQVGLLGLVVGVGSVHA